MDGVSRQAVRRAADLMNAGLHAEAECAARELVSRIPEHGLAWKIYGAALLLQGKDARHPLGTAARLLRDDAETHLYLGDALYEQDQAAAAILCFRRVLKIRPDLPEGHDHLGLALHEIGAFEEALTSYDRALKLQPNLAAAHGNRGNVLRDLGRLAEAVASYRRMLELEPHIAEAHNNLGNALLALGRFEEAERCYERALELRPNSAGALVNLGRVLWELGKPRQAIVACKNAIKIRPDLADAHQLIGYASFDLGRLHEATASYGRALAMEPGSADLHAALAMAYRQMGKTADADTSCRRALDITPDFPQALALLGDLHADHGRFTAAGVSFRRALAIDENFPEGWAGIARYRKMTAADGDWREAALRCLSRSPPIRQEIILRNALGKYFDDVEDRAQAFASYRAANELSKKITPRYDRDRVARHTDAIMRHYDRQWLRLAAETTSAARGYAAQPGLERPVFIVGMPRSGTTLAERIIASHPQAASAGELGFWRWAVSRYEASEGHRASANNVLAQFSDDYLRQLDLVSPSALRVIDKMPANVMNLGLIHAALPAARIIHMQRDPMDTGLSIYFQILSAAHAYANDLEDIAHYYAQYLRLSEHWRVILPETAILSVPYEGLVSDSETWIRRMLEFIDLPWDRRCLEFYRSSGTVSTASNWQVRQPISRTSVGRWRHYERFLGALRPVGLSIVV
jgi:tetratricopeptide (TPR) repeat protein